MRNVQKVLFGLLLKVIFTLIVLVALQSPVQWPEGFDPEAEGAILVEEEKPSE